MKRNHGGGLQFRGETLESRRCLTAGFSTAEIDFSEAGDVTAVAVTDLDRDGDADVVAATKEHGIAWYQNLDGAGRFGARQPISATDGGHAVWMDAADIDGDGDADVIAASLGTQDIFWFENLDGAGRFGNKKVATPTLRGGISVALSDLDGDNDLDLLWGFRRPKRHRVECKQR